MHLNRLPPGKYSVIFKERSKRGKSFKSLMTLCRSLECLWGCTTFPLLNCTQNQRKLCGANSRAIDLLPPPGPGAEWTKDLPIDQGREADQVRNWILHPNLSVYLPSPLRLLYAVHTHRHAVLMYVIIWHSSGLRVWRINRRDHPSWSDAAQFDSEFHRFFVDEARTPPWTGQACQGAHSVQCGWSSCVLLYVFVSCAWLTSFWWVAVEMNRHHFALFVRNCRLILLLRREFGDGDLKSFKPAEFRWKLPQVTTPVCLFQRPIPSYHYVRLSL